MKQTEFNLCTEPWIPVMADDCSVREVSLEDALLNAHSYADLRGELPTQDVAVMRLLLAILYTIFSRVDADGNPAPLRTAEDAFVRWGELWERGRFPEKPIQDYLAEWRERFWLFHPQMPFWQVPEADKGTAYTAAKLNGEMSESSNKLRLFAPFCGEGKESLTYAQAARWLLYVNGYDDTSAKPKEKGLPSPGCGWLGQLGLISAAGENLFETLMLNLTMLRDGEQCWDGAHPCWEREKPRAQERTEIPLPKDIAELYTLQSRRLLLMRSADKVTGYSLLGGDFFPKVNALSEQMTVWAPVMGKGSEIDGYRPRRHDPSRQMWREFANLFLEQSNARRPGVVQWITQLKNGTGLLKKEKMVHFRIASVQYGDKDFFMTDVFEDTLTFHADLLASLGRGWQTHIADEIARCDLLAAQVGYLAGDLEKAAGSKNETAAPKAKEQFYHQLDVPFRRWLVSIDPLCSRAEELEKRQEWLETVQEIARKMGREMVEISGENAFTGRMVTVRDHGKEISRHYSAPESLNWFYYQVKKICNS